MKNPIVYIILLILIVAGATAGINLVPSAPSNDNTSDFVPGTSIRAHNGYIADWYKIYDPTQRDFGDVFANKTNGNISLYLDTLNAQDSTIAIKDDIRGTDADFKNVNATFFNWTVTDNWNSFDGSTLDFNESKLSTTDTNSSDYWDNLNTEADIDHGSISGLTDDDHPLYVVNNTETYYYGGTNITDKALNALIDEASSVTEVNLAFDTANQSELDTHTGDTGNPHSVTANQVGAIENNTDEYYFNNQNITDLALSALLDETGSVESDNILDNSLGNQDFANAKINKTSESSLDVNSSDYWDNLNTESDLNVSNIPIAMIGNPTNDSIQDWLNNVQSAGKISGGGFTDNGDGTLTVAEGTGFVKTTDNEIGFTKIFNWSQNNDVQTEAGGALTDGASNHIYVSYNGSNPAIYSTTSKSDVDHNTEFFIGKVYRDGTTLHFLEGGTIINNLGRRTHERLGAVGGFERASGLQTSETGTRNVAITQGKFFRGLNEFSVSSFDSSNVDENFSLWYNDGSWQEVTEQSVLDEQYNDYGTGLASLGNNRHGNFWVYMHEDGDIHIVYGQGSYSLGEAQGATPPASLPTKVSSMSVLIAKVIIAEADSDGFEEVETAWTNDFVPSAVTDHNDLAGLQGGATDQYYHLTSVEHGNTSNWDIAYSERGSQIAGSSLTWDGNELDVGDNWYDSIGDLPTDAINDGDTSHIATNDQIYDWVTGQSYLTSSPFGSTIDDTELTSEDFGDFTCDGTEDSCSLDSNSVTNDELTNDKVNKSGDTMSGPLDMGNNNITGIKESVQEHAQINKSINNTNEEIINTSTNTFKVEFEFEDGQWSNGSTFHVWKGETAGGSHGEWWYWASNDSLECWEYVNDSGYRKEGCN